VIAQISPRLQIISLSMLSLAALAIFAWPFLPLGIEAQAASYLSLAAIAIILVFTLLLLDGDLSGPKAIGLIAILAALGASVRIATGGTGGIELVFLTVILAGRAYGPRFGFLLGVATIALSSLFFGGFGPWTAYQMFATGWVGAGAGLLPGRGKQIENLLLAGYGAVSAYLFGLLLNLWFWPVAITGSSLSYQPAGAVGENLASFLLFSLASSTLSWDTVRAISVALVLLVVTKPALRALERAKLQRT
jgi:energy-coupling factor transport system substrate-specific component